MTSFCSQAGDSHTSANLESCWPKALRLDGSIRDPNALHMTMLERVRRRAQDFGPARIPVEGERTEGRPNAKVTIDLAAARFGNEMLSPATPT